MRLERLYVLRIWLVGERPEVWRMRLGDLCSRETVYFESLETLVAFLLEQLKVEP